MPESQQWVLVYAKWANQQVLCWENVGNKWTDFDGQDYDNHMFTYWSPLPEPPSE
nr:DUF551 domain-containing protein [Enterobacter asburiae]